MYVGRSGGAATPHYSRGPVVPDSGSVSSWISDERKVLRTDGLRPAGHTEISFLCKF